MGTRVPRCLNRERRQRPALDCWEAKLQARQRHQPSPQETGAALQEQPRALAWDLALAEEELQAEQRHGRISAGRQNKAGRKSRNKQLNKVHVVLGKKSSDLDSIISALTYAYYLEKVSPPDVLCLPVLNIPRREFYYNTEARFILEELNIPESLHVFRDEINLYQLNSEGKLSLTLVNSSALTSEDNILESAVVRVINPEERCDGNPELLESSSSLVAKEILHEAPELITQQLAHLLRGSILFKTMAVAPEKISEEQEEVLSSLEEKFPELLPREDIIIVLQEARFHTDGLSLEEALIKDLKEVSDGEIKVAVTTVYMNLEIEPEESVAAAAAAAAAAAYLPFPAYNDLCGLSILVVTVQTYLLKMFNRVMGGE
ncbi:hypothetical protein lerEdw1_000137 [Lerista edwardsae]|nr:hypothetical protein lerEdw1_000137 [Lerista edwardsae]